jgi:hypothetical protein
MGLPLGRGSSRGAAFADFDNDGDVDVLVMNMHEGPSLLRNDSATGNGWLQIVGPGPGAVVTVEAGGRKQAQAVLSQSSFLSYNGRRLHFGLGTAGRVDGVTVAWPSGRTERFVVEGVNKLVQLEEGKGTR